MTSKAAERIKYRTEVLKLLVLLVVAVGGGSIGLMLGPLSPLRAVLVTAGILVTLALLVAAWRQHRHIEWLIEQPPEDL